MVSALLGRRTTNEEGLGQLHSQAVDTHMISKMPRLRAAFVVGYALCVGSIVLRGQVPIEVGSRDRTSSLPEGAGRNLVIATCTQCHSLGPIVLQRKSEVQWVRTVRDMIARGAQIAPD